MATHIISATEATRSLSNILNKVHYQGQSFDIKRGKEIIAKIVPSTTKRHTMKFSELCELLKRLPSLDPQDSEAFENDINEIRSHMSSEESSWD